VASLCKGEGTLKDAEINDTSLICLYFAGDEGMSELGGGGGRQERDYNFFLGGRVQPAVLEILNTGSDQHHAFEVCCISSLLFAGSEGMRQWVYSEGGRPQI
jgi:hypothetical protein